MKVTSRRQFLLIGGGTILSSLSSYPVSVSAIDVNVKVKDQLALTKLVIEMSNPGNRVAEGQCLIPVPNGAVLKKYTLDGVEGLLTAVKSSVFPVPAKGKVKLEITYEGLLENDGGRVDYILPRTQALDYKIPWKLSLEWMSSKDVLGVYSPSHDVEVEKLSPRKVKISPKEPLQPGSFRLSLMTKASDKAAASFYICPEEEKGRGHFMMILSPPGRDKNAPKVKREVTLVIDKSGSMAGVKMDQVKASALQVIEGLDDGEVFNIIVYNEAVEGFAQEPVVKSRETTLHARKYISSIRVSGGTNINGALHTALKQNPKDNFLPLVVFFTDGVPTIGETNEKLIRENVVKVNQHNRRIFSFGVGVDVNTPLMNSVSTDSKGLATFVLPKENVELAVAQVFRRLSGPVLKDINLIGNLKGGGKTIVQDMLPQSLNDFYDQDQQILLGRYTGSDGVTFFLQGNDGNKLQKFEFTMDISKGSSVYDFVPRLWATRKISTLVEALREQGASGDSQVSRTDPKIKELVDEVVRLSIRYGILTEYTAFLAKDAKPIHTGNIDAFWSQTSDKLEQRAMKARVGEASVNQEMNLIEGKQMATLNKRNRYLTKELEVVEESRIQQVGRKTYVYRGNTWNDTTVEKETDTIEVNIGTVEFNKLVDDLVAENEQACLALAGEIVVNVKGTNYRINR